MLRKLHTNPSKFFWVRPPQKLEGFVWSFLSITGYHLRDNLPRNAHFWQVGLLDIVLSEYPDKSQNFRNFIFYDVITLVLYSVSTYPICDSAVISRS